MATISYKINGKLVKMEVSEEFATSYAEYVKADEMIERKELRRHQSLDKSLNNGFDVADESSNVEDTVIKQEEIEELYKAIKTLEPKQQRLVNQIFFQGRTMTSIALENGISQAAITQQMQVINARLKRILEKFKSQP
ncbi:sigma-70 family RNA polymerase sigma factor [bacterium]|nr:sigma-70 family RNA polymerase sigma factor [bacterium]